MWRKNWQCLSALRQPRVRGVCRWDRRPRASPRRDSREPALSEVEGRLSLREQLFWRDPVDFFFDRAFVEKASALQNCFAVLDHLGMAAKIGVGVAGVKTPLIGVFAEDVVGAPGLPGPVSVIPGPAYGRDIFEPWNFLGEAR